MALLAVAASLNCCGMIDAAIKALSQMFAPNLRHVLLKAAGLALILITFIGILMQRFLASWAETGANWAEQATGVAPHALWSSLAWVLSILAGLGIITGALFLMPAVTAFVGSFFVDEIAEAVEREHYPAEPLGRALPFFLALIEGIKFAALALLIYICALPFIFLSQGCLSLHLCRYRSSIWRRPSLPWHSWCTYTRSCQARGPN